MRSVIEHIIQTMYDGKGLDSAESAFGRMDDVVKRADTSLRVFGENAGNLSLRSVADTFNEVTDMAGKLKAGIEAAWETLDEGRSLDQARDRFEALSKSIGTSAESLTAQLTTATQGAMTQAQLAATIGQLIETGLVGSADQASHLADMIIRLKKPTDDISDAFGNFSSMLLNQSIPRLDSFGISGAAVRDDIDRLMRSTEGLTREQAFLQAVMEQGEKTLQRTGQASGSTVSDMERLRAKLSDLKDGFIVALYEGMQPLIESAAEFVGSHGPELAASITSVADLAVTLGRGLAGFASYVGQTINRDFVEPWQRATQHTGNLADMGFDQMLDELFALEIQTNTLEQQLKTLGIPVQNLRDYFGQLQDQYSGGFLEVGGDVAALRVYLSYLQSIVQQMSGDDMPALTTATLDYASAGQLAREYADDMTATLEETSTTATRLTANWQHSTVELRLASEAWQTYQDRVQAVNDASRDYFTTALQMEEPTLNLADAVLHSADAAGLSAGALNSLLGAMGLFQETGPDTAETVAETALKMAYLQLAIDDVTAAFARGELTAPEAAAAIEEYQRRANAADFTPLNNQLAATLGLLRDIIANSDVTIKTRYETEGAPPATAAPAQGAQGPKGLPGSPTPPPPPPMTPPAYEYASGGYTGPYGGVVHPHELVVPGYVLAGGAQSINRFAQQHVPGGVSAESGTTNIFNIDARGSTLTEAQFRAVVEQVLVEQARDLAVYRAMR